MENTFLNYYGKDSPRKAGYIFVLIFQRQVAVLGAARPQYLEISP
jgi:hypothetical protein